MNQTWKSVLAVFFCLIIAASCKAQFNINVGYNLSLPQTDQLDNVLDRFNADNTWLDRRFNSFNTVNGLLLGLKYRLENSTIEFNLYSRFRNVRAEGTDPSTNNDYYRKISLKSRGLSLGLSQAVGMIEFGASIDRDNFILERQTASDGDFSDLVNISRWSNHIYLGVSTPKSSGLSITLRPFVQIPWTSYNLDALESDLGYAPTGKKEKFFNYGIQVIFSNGK